MKHCMKTKISILVQIAKNMTEIMFQISWHLRYFVGHCRFSKCFEELQYRQNFEDKTKHQLSVKKKK